MDYESLKTDLLPSFIDSLLSDHEASLNRSGSLLIRGEKLLLKDFAPWMMTNAKPYLDLLIHAPSANHLFETVRTTLKMAVAKNRLAVFKGADAAVSPFSYDNVIPFISLENHRKIIFFSKDTKEITDLDYETYSISVDKDFKLRPLPAKIEFNPYRPEQIYMEQYLGQECTHLNTYRKPEWQLARKLTPQEATTYAKLPLLIDQFFDHLFPNPRCKEFVYDWLHFAVASRCETYLVMNGAKGIGKNVLSNSLCPSLLGKNNHKVAHKGAMKDFNVILAESRMIVFDEFKMVDDDSINTLKRFANSDQMIERKCIDVGKTEKTYNSFIICNNAITDMKIEWDDRRFSVTDITDKKLTDSWSKDKIKIFVDMVENPLSPEIRQFGYWLLYRKPTVMTDAFSAYTGEHFHKLCYTSFPEWAKMIIDEVTTANRADFEASELSLMFKTRTNGMHRFPHKTKVEDFLKNYKHEGEHYLGHIEKDDSTWYLQVNEHFYTKVKSDNTNIKWASLEGLL